MEEIEVPSHFLCPISLQLMRDPVTVSTGITYDRDSIEKWLFLCKNNTCPITKQTLSDPELTPNHTLRRLIQSWCTLNSSHGVERIPTPKPPINKSQILKLVNEYKNACQQTKLKSLKTLKSIAQGCERNKICMENAGIVEFLALIIREAEPRTTDIFLGSTIIDHIRDEAISVLYNFESSDSSMKRLLSNNGEFIHSLTQVLKHGTYQSRAYAIMLLKSILNVADPVVLTGLDRDLFIETLNVLKDNITQQASKAALKLLVEVCPWGRNRIKAVEAGAVFTLIEILLEGNERRVCELGLVGLDILCGCAEGRAEFLRHGAGLAVVSKKILRVSHLASSRAVKILSNVSRFCASSRVLQEMLNVGVVSKLCLVIQVESGGKTKDKAREILKLHSRVWKDSSCVPVHLLSSYPI